MGGKPDQQGELTDLGQSAIPSQLTGDMSGVLGALPQQKQEYQMNATTPDAMQPQLQTLLPKEGGGVLGPGQPQPQPQGMALFSPLNQFLLANSGNNPLLNNMPGMMMPNRFERRF
jgi:hypothetical protein